MFSEADWNWLFSEAVKDGGLIISKVAPPSGAMCDHKESVWDYYQKTIRRMMAKHRFRVYFESRSQVHLKAAEPRRTPGTPQT